MATIHTFAAGLKPFEYKEEIVRNQIRLLKLVTITEGGLPHFTFTIVDLQNPPIVPYIALSYVWGSEIDRWPIVVDGARLMVTQNCWAALAYLEPRLRESHIWVDAICINQGYAGDGAANLMNFKREKAGQIAQMGEIYSYASNVAVFLGMPFKGSDIAMRDMHRIGGEALEAGIELLTTRHMSTWPSFTGLADHERSEAIIVRNRLDKLMQRNLGGIFSGPGIAIEAMTAILDKPWFTRAWIIQELALPQPGTVTFNCGAAQCSWERMWAATFLLNLLIARQASAIQQAPSWLSQWMPVKAFLLLRFRWQTGMFPTWTGSRASTTLSIRKQFWRHDNPRSGAELTVATGWSLKHTLTLLYVGDIAKMLNCRDPEDKIRAIHGLLTPGERQWLTSLLTKQPALTWVDLYTAVAWRLISDGHVDTLSLCRAGEGRGEAGGAGERDKLPSWVPDWRYRVREPWSGLKQTLTNSADQTLFRASLDTVCRVSMLDDFTPHRSVLTIAGHGVDRIAKVGSAWAADLENDFDWQAAKTMLREIEEFLDISDVYTNENREEAKWRIPIGDKERNLVGQIARAGELSRIGHLTMKRALQSSAPNQSSPDAGAISYLGMMRSMYGSRSFISEKGYVGLCPSKATQGAVVFMPLGGHVPYVIEDARLIRADRGKQATQRLATEWKLLGEAYVHGIMDGELELSSHAEAVQDYQLI